MASPWFSARIATRVSAGNRTATSKSSNSATASPSLTCSFTMRTIRVRRRDCSSRTCSISPPRRLGVACRLSSAFAQRRVTSPAASRFLREPPGRSARRSPMFYERLHVTFVGVVATLVDSVVIAEFAGYWLHRLLHSDKFPALSRGHLIHHFLIYGPRQSMRATEYLDATDNRTSVGNVGIEWLAPSAIILLFCWGAMALLGVPPLIQA